MRKLIKIYLKKMTKEQRAKRLMFLGKRSIIKQYQWLHFSSHPWEDSDKE